MESEGGRACGRDERCEQNQSTRLTKTAHVTLARQSELAVVGALNNYHDGDDGATVQVDSQILATSFTSEACAARTDNSVSIRLLISDTQRRQ